jgi:hypothetical protein
MKIEKKMVPEYGITLDGVWIPYDTLENLAEQGPYTSQFGVALTLQRDEGRVLEEHDLAARETRGGYHGTDKLKKFLQDVTWPGE